MTSTMPATERIAARITRKKTDKEIVAEAKW